MSIAAIYDVPAPAKLNLYLHVVGRRADGMHLLESLMVLIDWCDTIHVEPRGDGLLRRHDTAAALPADDLSLRAARALQAASGTAARASTSRSTSGSRGAPGSAAAARTPRRRCSPSTASGASTGRWNGCFRSAWPSAPTFPSSSPEPTPSPPASASGWCRADVAPAWFAVVKPAAGLATGEVFARPEVAERVAAARIAGFSEAIPGVDGEPGALGEIGPRLAEGFGTNDLQAAAEGLCPEVERAASALSRAFGNSRMTGSGSAVFARAGSGPAPSAAMPSDWPAGWSGRMCRSLRAPSARRLGRPRGF